MKTIDQNRKFQPIKSSQILSMVTGKTQKESAEIIRLTNKLKEVENDRDYWRELAIQKQQTLEVYQNANK
jgi:transcription elongation factor